MVEFKADLSATVRQTMYFFGIVIDVGQKRRVAVNGDTLIA